MQVSVEKSGLERRVTVQVPEERVASAVEERLKSMSRTSRIQGFRPGKAPLRVVKQRFGAQARGEVVEKLVTSSLVEAVAQEDIQPIGTPLIDPLRAEAGEGLSYTATFEVLPELKLNPAEDLQIERPECELTEADIDQAIARLRRQQSDFRPVARAADTGDRVNIDYQGIPDDEGKDITAQGVDVEIGAGWFVPGMEDGLKGATAGESLELDITFPEDFDSARLSGKLVRFRIQVNRVDEPVLPEWNEEFFARFGVAEGGEQAFRQEVRRQLQQQVDGAQHSHLRDSVMQALLDANEVETPNTLVKAEIQRMLDLATSAGDRAGARRDTAEAAARLAESQDVRDMARRRVALQLLTRELARANDLQARPERVRELIETRAQSYQDPAAMINWYYNDRQRLAEIEALALEDELLEWVAARARVSKVALSFDELVNKGQTQ